MLSAKNDTDPTHLKAAVIGGGLMGHALAATMLAAGCKVSVFEANEDLRRSLPERIKKILVECQADPQLAEQAQLPSCLEEMDRDVELIIEAIPEDLQMKQQLFCDLEALFPSAILASNSSVYRVGDIAARTSDKSRVLGTHWWNPPHLIPIVEVVQGEATAPEALDWVMELLREMGKTPVHVRKDTAGFIGNRLQHALWREALALVEEGVADAATVDMVATGTLGLKLGAIGPLENADYVGLDLTRAIHEYVFPALSRAVVPSALLNAAVAEGRLGAKTGEGLTHWPEGRRANLALRLAEHIRAQLAGQESGS